MSMFNPYWKCSYDELITFYPRFYREVFEMNAILKAEGGLADGIRDGIDKMLMNNFIDGADEETLTKLETFLDLSMMRERTVEERRRFIKSFFAGMGKVSETRIAEMIRAYTNADTVCNFYPFDSEKNNRLDIMFERGSEQVIYISDIYTLLAKMLPAHIEYRPVLTYRYSVGAKIRRKHHKYAYDLCGTKPYSVLIAQIEGVTAVVEANVDGTVMDYKISSCDGEISGQYPNTAMLAQIEGIMAATRAEINDAVIIYKNSQDGGTEPQTGLYPQVAALGHNDAINAATEVCTSDCGVSYIPCGTTFTR